MAQIRVRNLDDTMVERLKKRAREGRHSLQSEVRFILIQAAAEPKVDMAVALKIARAFRRKFKGRTFPDTAELIRQGRAR